MRENNNSLNNNSSLEMMVDYEGEELSQKEMFLTNGIQS